MMSHSGAVTVRVASLAASVAKPICLDSSLITLVASQVFGKESETTSIDTIIPAPHKTLLPR